jgi:pyruvate/2-oxoglutarate dehydrogenase complex dihydrolipoamide dehydrogenase (E3) component
MRREPARAVTPLESWIKRASVHPRLDAPRADRGPTAPGHAGTANDHPVIPRVTFADREMASVGLPEAQARAAGGAVASGRADLGSRGLTHGLTAEAGLVKLVADAERQALVGATAVGPYAGDVLFMLTFAIHAQVPISTLRTMIFAHPTFRRAVLAALGEPR